MRGKVLGKRRKKGLKRGVVLGEGSITCKYEGEDFRKKRWYLTFKRRYPG